MNELPSIPSSADVGEPPEPYAVTSKPIGCDPTEKVGVRAFRDWVMTNVGGGTLGIVRPCNVGKPSQHHVGSAWDWAANASKPEDQAMVARLLDWLLAGDPDGAMDAMLRRAGIAFMIWDGRIWGTWNRDWSPYDGDNPHTDHVHFSFSDDGANARTSFYRWIGTEPAPKPGPSPVGPDDEDKPTSAIPLWVGGLSFLAAAAATYYLPRLLRRWPRAERRG
jgi:hypothetical protein